MPFWFPKLLNPWVAALAAAITIPLLVILYFLKLRRKEMTVSSTLLWRKAIQDLQVNAPFQKLKWSLLLLLQLILLALLSLALARPVANVTPSATHLTVILIDHSASMSTIEDFGGSKRTRLEEAQRQAKELVDSMHRHDMATVIAFTDMAEVRQTFTSDPNGLKNAIDRIEPTDRRTKLALAYKLAESQTASFPEQQRGNEAPGIFVYSDGRASDVKDVAVRGDLKYTKIGNDDTPNIGIVTFSAQRNYEHPEQVQVFARLANYGPAPVRTDVQLSIDGVVASDKTDLLLLPERWNDKDFPADKKDTTLVAKDSVSFPKLELLKAAVIKLEQTNKDALASDDAAIVVVPPPKPLAVLLVSEGNLYLERAINSMGLQKPDTLAPPLYEQKKPQQYDVIIFDRYEPKYMPSSGNFMWFDAIPPGSRVQAVKENGQPVILPATSILDWNREHPILRGLQLSKLVIDQSIKLQLPVEAEVLVESFKGPLIVLQHEGRSTHLICAFDLLQTNWPRRPSFPVFMDSAVQYLALGTDMDVRQSFQPGATPKIPRTDLQKIEAKLGKPLQEIKLGGPMGSITVTVPQNGDLVLPPLDKVGLYTTDPPIPRLEKIAVSLLDASESNIEPLEDLPNGISIATKGNGKSRLELWWWIIACAALPLLFVEWWVYTRRVA
jgi:hypothetical protein